MSEIVIRAAYVSDILVHRVNQHLSKHFDGWTVTESMGWYKMAETTCKAGRPRETGGLMVGSLAVEKCISWHIGATINNYTWMHELAALYCEQGKQECIYANTPKTGAVLLDGKSMKEVFQK